MLLKMHDIFKINLNIGEIHLQKFWFQNTKHIQSYRRPNFDLSFLCTKVSLFKLKKVCNFFGVENFAAKNFSEIFYTNMKK